MKSILAARGSNRRMSVSSSSSAMVDAAARDEAAAAIANEPSVHVGKMRLQSSAASPNALELRDVVFSVGARGVHVMAELGQEAVHAAQFERMKEVVWDHSEKSVQFAMLDGQVSPMFFFRSLTLVEAQIGRAVQNPELHSRPEHIFMGVLAGRTLPSPMQQRRSSSCLLRADAPAVALSASRRRELLQQERPARNAASRERLATEFFRSGHLSFACSIKNDLRGLKLDLHYISVFPSPDCYDRSACLFSYPYEHVGTCEAVGTRLELRFRRSSTKQPTLLTLQSLEVHYIREAIWYLQHGAFLDVSLRARAAASFAATFSDRERQRSPTAAPAPRRGPLAYFEDASVIQQRIETRCRVMGCQRHAEASDSAHESDVSMSSMLSQNTLSHASCGLSTTRAECVGRVCDEHLASLSLPRSPSKRSAFFPRDRSKAAPPLTLSPHYLRMLTYQSPLLKRSGAKTSRLAKAWNLKFAAVFETPVGSFLCYYDKLAHCPGMTESPKERRVIDLSSVICIRPESAAATASTPLAFDVVTIYRVWTFAATEPEEYETWLQVLADAVEKQTSTAPDKRLKFPVRMMATAQTAQQHQLTRHEATSLEVSPYGVCVCSGHEGESEIYSWYFTDIQRWSVVYRQSEACCLLSCQSGKSGGGGADAPPYHEVLLQTPEAPAICQAIEFYVGKCMAKLEVLAVSVKETATRVRRGLSDSTLPIGVPELVRYKSEQLVKSPPSHVEELGKEEKRRPLPAQQHLISGVPLKPALDDELPPPSLVPVVDLSLSPVPLLESPEFLRSDRFDSSFSCGALDADDAEDNDSDRFESFGYLECVVFEAHEGPDDDSARQIRVFSSAADALLADQLTASGEGEGGRAIAMKASESPKRVALGTTSAGSGGAKPKRTAGDQFPLIPKRKSPKKKDAAGGSKQRLELPKVSATTYSHSPRALDTGEELEILKAILVREGYLQRLTQASSHGRISGSHLGDTVDLLDLLRIATLEVVEAVAAWRRKKRSQEPYRWNGLNYLLKLPSDLDFLQKHSGLVQWLGFTLERNPFVLPVNLDCRAKLAPGGDRRTRGAEQANGIDSGQFIEVGGKRRLDSSSSSSRRPESPGKAAAHAAALAERKRAKNPYETRVLNDEELLPLNGERGTTAAATRPKSRAATAAPVIPSQIGELDMTRIRDAEELVLEEEERCGRFTRDAQGLVVPEEEALRRRNMAEMSGGAYAALARDRLPDDQEERSGGDDPNFAQLASHSLALPGRVYAKKRAGMLGPISKPTPRKRSRGAQLEDALERERQANASFGVLIDALREETERKEMDVAYFESLAGVQFYGDELREFGAKAREEIAVLRRELAEKLHVYARKSENIHRKAEIIQAFKAQHQAAVEAAREAAIDDGRSRAGTGDDAEAERSRAAHATASAMADGDQQRDLLSRLSNQDDVTRTRSLVAPIVQHMCATLIQKLARGVITRAAVGSLRIEYFVASTYLQAAVRGFLARRRVARMFWAHAASVAIQRVARGMLARRLVCGRRRLLRELASTVLLQKLVRGHFGRVRMRKVRRLCGAQAAIAAAAAHVSVSDLKELADACLAMVALPPRDAKSLTSLVLGLVRVLMLFTSDCDAAVDVANVRWKEAAAFLRCAVGLARRMQKIASAVAGRRLRVSALGDALLDAYMGDRDFHADTFQRLERGWKAASAIFRWVTAFSVVTRLQAVLPAYNVGGDGPFLVASATSAREAAQDRVEQQESATREEDAARRFVPAALLQAAGFPRHRPRPVVLVVAHDVPLEAKTRIVERLLAALPGLFVVLNRDSSNQQQQHSSRRRRADWGGGLDVADIRGAVGLGHSVVLESDIGLSDPPRRQFLGAFAAVKAAIHPPPLCVLVQGSLLNCAAKGGDGRDDGDHRTMADASLKRAFERATEHLAALASPRLTALMAQVSAVESPAVAFVVVVEAAIVLLTPTKRYDGPKATTSFASWRLGRRLLADPLFFCRRLRNATLHAVPPENLQALDEYVRHSAWPTNTRAHALGAAGELLFALASWVEAAVQCAHLVADCRGLAPELSRSTPVRGLFGSVVTFRDTSAGGGEGQEHESGVDACVLQLLDAVLADVLVHRASHALDGRRCVVRVHHDCQRVFLSAYDPASSWRWHAVVLESEVDALLAPNSVERGSVKTPPQTRAEMYDRLVRLCLLQARRSPQASAEGLEAAPAALAAKQLVVRPPSIRLYRRALQLGGFLATVTISELSRGRVQVDAFVASPSLGRDLRAVFGLESILARLSARQVAACFVAPAEIPRLVLDRLHLFRVAPSRPAPGLEPLAAPVKLAIRARESAPGRLLVRKAVRSPWLAGVWVLSVFANHAARDFRAEFYEPQTSARVAVRLSPTDCEDFVVQSKHASAAALQRMMRRFRFHVDPETGAPDSCVARRVLARFPWSLPVEQSALHAVHARAVVRAYVHVERRERDAATSTVSTSTMSPPSSPRFLGQLHYRICLPDSCAEQTLVLEDSEVESFFADGSWLSASSMAERRRMSHALVRSFVWEPAAASSASPAAEHSSGRVVARLPSGAVGSFVSTRVTGTQKQPPPPSRPLTRTKRSPFSARGSVDQAPVLSSCVQLLDATAAPLDSSRVERRCYTYDAEELVHQGRYRATGVLVTVQVFMKAVVVDTLVPQIPVDRVAQEDSFVLTLRFYHPGSSSGAAVRISGLRELREVVGPDYAELIRASSVHELMQHIVERRAEIALAPVARAARSQSFRGLALGGDGDQQPPQLRLEVNLQRDRLFAKQKATPVTRSLAPDLAANAAKLIDTAPERGLKVLTKTRQLRDFGRVIFTVFDVAFTRRLQSGGKRDAGDALAAAVFRVDAYVHATSSRLSLVVEGDELLCVTGGSLELLVGAPDAHSGELSSEEERKRQLAQLIVDHVGIEVRRDGVTSDRLFVTEYFAPPSSPNAVAQQRSERRRLLFKSTRALGHDHLLVSVHLLAACAVAIRCYEPHSSESAEVVVERETLGLALGLSEAELTPSVLLAPPIPPLVLMTHICAFVRVAKHAVALLPQTSGVASCAATLTAAFELDEASARASRRRLEAGEARLTEGRAVVGSWSGMALGGARACYFAVRLCVLATDAPAEFDAVCSALSPSTASAASVRFAASELERIVCGPDEETALSAEDALGRLREHLRVELVDVAPCEGNELGVAVSIALA